jgi:hypothetical protein
MVQPELLVPFVFPMRRNIDCGFGDAEFAGDRVHRVLGNVVAENERSQVR